MRKYFSQAMAMLLATTMILTSTVAVYADDVISSQSNVTEENEQPDDSDAGSDIESISDSEENTDETAEDEDNRIIADCYLEWDESDDSSLELASASTLTLSQLQAKFPDGKYWNHTSGSSNNPDGYTSTPCGNSGMCQYHGGSHTTAMITSGSCGCNSYSSAIQCMGFAFKCGYDTTGSNPRNWSTTTSLDNLKAGDIIRYKNDGHSIFVTGVSGDTITYGDCNSDGHCKIRWNATISKSTVKSTLTCVYVNPSGLRTDDSCTYVDVGTNFYAYIINNNQSAGSWRHLGLNGSNVVTQGMEGSGQQLWYFERQSDGSYKITNTQTQKCLDVYSGNSEPGTAVWVWESNDTAAQRWYVTGSIGYYQLHPACATDCSLDVCGGSGEAGAVVQIYTTNETGAQTFSFVHVNPEAVTVSAVSNGEKVSIGWNTFCYYDSYSVRIFKDAIYTGTDYSQLNLTGNSSVAELPDGHYYIYVDSGTGSLSMQSNVVEVDVKAPECTGSIAYNGEEYRLYESKSDWDYAKAYCEAQGGHLAVITSAEEMEQITALIGGSTGYYFIGATDSENEGEWKWVTGEAFDYTAWGSGEPNNDGSGEDYLMAWQYEGTGIWNDTNRTSIGFICEIESPSPELSGSITYHGNEYKLYESKSGWNYAKAYCEAEGGHLATITSAEEMEKITTLIGESTGYYYLGATDSENEGEWKWVTGEAFDYTAWGEGEPNNDGSGEDYLMVWQYEGNGLWNDTGNSPIGFICEIEGEEEIVQPVIFTAQPQSVTAVLKSKVTFTVAAENAASYQWQYSKNNGETWSDLKDSSTASSFIDGAITDTLTILATDTRCGYIYRCQVTGTNGEVVNSDAATLTKDATLTITTQPKDTVGTLMKKTTFKVAAVNAVSYQWQYSKNEGASWNTLKNSENTSTYLGGATTSTVTMLMNASRSSFTYRCQITGEDGTVAYTDPVKVLLFAITTQPESVQAKSGDTVTFSLSVDYAKSYQWYYQKTGSTSWYKLTDNTKASMLISGSTSDTLTMKMTKTRMTYRYRCKVIGQNGTSKYSDAVEILSE